MKAEYRRDTHHSYLVLYEEEKEGRESFQKKMFLKNSIPGFLPCTMHQIDQCERYFYDISSRQSLSSVLETKAVDLDMLEKLLTSILQALNGLQSFLMDTGGFTLRPDWIFLAPSGETFAFCYFPDGDFSWKEQLQKLSEQLLPHLEHKNREAVRLGYDFYQSCAEGKITVSELEQLLKARPEEPVSRLGKDTSEAGEREREIPGTREELLNAFFAPELPEKKEERQEVSPEMKKRKRSLLSDGVLWQRAVLFVPAVIFGTGVWICWFFGYDSVALIAAIFALISLLSAGLLIWQRSRERETDSTMEQYVMVQDWLEEEKQEENLLQIRETGEPEKELSEEEEKATDGEATCLLTGEAAMSRLARGYLVPEAEEGGQTIAVSKNLTMIGKSSQMDVILRALGVSRIHARIVFREGKCFLTDLNSRNGTTLNGILLKPQEEQLLADGDRICFANQEYRWKRYR